MIQDLLIDRAEKYSSEINGLSEHEKSLCESSYIKGAVSQHKRDTEKACEIVLEITKGLLIQSEYNKKQIIDIVTKKMEGAI